MNIPDWVAAAIERSENPRRPSGLLFHGTIEPFEGPLQATGWEGLLWFSNDPVISQSYCPAAGLSALWSECTWRSADRFVPSQDLGEKLFAAMGFDIAAMDMSRDERGHVESYRILPDHPTHGDVARYVREDLGYVIEDGSCWISLKGEKVMPASWKEAGRLYVLRDPGDLRLHDMRKGEGGLSGRQWMETEVFAAARAEGYDGVIISDIHQTPRLGHFEHTSWGLFPHVLDKADIWQTPCAFFDPAASWYGEERGATTPEWKTILDAVLMQHA